MNIKRKYGLALKVLAIVLVLIAVKTVLDYFGLQFAGGLSTLFATIVGGTIFLVGLILSGTLSDYKEGEKIVSDIAASLESVLQEGVFVKQVKPEFDLDAHKRRLWDIITAFRADLKTKERDRSCIEKISRLSDSMAEMERIGASSGLFRIKGQQDGLYTNILRAFHIKETSFVSAAYAIVEIISVAMIGVLLLMEFESFYEMLLTPAVVMYIYLYMVFFVEDLDDPFGETGGYADVDMSLLDEFEKKVRV